jgi:hypothetical protein
MYKLKGCPRCNGDLMTVRETNSWLEHCLQCGYEREIKIIGNTPKGNLPHIGLKNE